MVLALKSIVKQPNNLAVMGVETENVLLLAKKKIDPQKSVEVSRCLVKTFICVLPFICFSNLTGLYFSKLEVFCNSSTSFRTSRQLLFCIYNYLKS